MTAPIRNEALANAYRFSGIIRADLDDLDDLERHSRDMAMQGLEDQLAKAWRDEVKGLTLPPFSDSKPGDYPGLEAARVARISFAEAHRDARTAKILNILKEGPLQRADMEGLLGLSQSYLKKVLRDLCDEGLITMTRIPGTRRSFAYEVAQ